MARLFMSTLGTSLYVEVQYALNNQNSPFTPFVQEALAGLICNSWDENDRIVIFCTAVAKEKNWKNRDAANPGGNFEKGLDKRLHDLKLKPHIEMVPIPEGKSETEIMEIFSKVTEQIKRDNEVVLDITHSYRSLPLLNTVILNYAKALKNITVAGIYYGAFEVLGSPDEVKNMEKEKRLAPVFDLTPYDRLLDWSVAVNEFENYGIAEHIRRLVNQDASSILREKKGNDQTARSVKKLASKICSISQNIRGARCFEIEKIEPLGDHIGEIKGQDIIEPLNPLMDRIARKTNGFGSKSPVEKGFQAVEWCLEHDLIPQGYIILRETVLSGLCRLLNRDVENYRYRESLSGLLNVIPVEKLCESWTGQVKDDPEEMKYVLETLGSRVSKFQKAFCELSNSRNDFMHCGCRPSPMKYKTLREKFERLYEDIKSSWFYLVTGEEYRDSH